MPPIPFVCIDLIIIGAHRARVTDGAPWGRECISSLLRPRTWQVKRKHCNVAVPEFKNPKRMHFLRSFKMQLKRDLVGAG